MADLLALTTAYVVAAAVEGGDGVLGSFREFLLFVLTLFCWVLIAQVQGLYQRNQERVDNPTTDDVVGVFYLATAGIWLLIVVSQLGTDQGPRVYSLIVLWFLAVGMVSAGRTIARGVCRRTSAYEQNAMIVGAGEIGQQIGRKLLKHPEYGINVVGFVDPQPRMRRADLPDDLAVLGTPEELPGLIDALEIERVVIAFSRIPISELLALLRTLRPRGVQIDVVPRLFELMGPRLTIHSLEEITMVGLPPYATTWVARMFKRAIDLVGATVALIVLAPPLAYIAVRIRLDSEGPILFRQTRLGRGRREFTALKFRTMKVDTDPAVHREYVRAMMTSAAELNQNGIYKLDRLDTVTKFGRWLRRTSLDELPQLLNVLRGDMSLVGPRPCIPYEAELFKPHHLERFAMPQGITGLWQVTARSNSSYGEALEMDVAYVRSWSLGLDLRLLLRTPLQVVRQRNATA